MLRESFSLDEFIKWYYELGKLKIFWAKPLKSIEVLIQRDNYLILRVEWIIRGKVRKALMGIIWAKISIYDVIGALSNYTNYDRIIMMPEDFSMNLQLVKARSILYFWNTDGKTLSPNEDVKFRVLNTWDKDETEMFAEIQKNSWGFFIPPRSGDHVVIVGFLDDNPVSLAYLNIHNYNIDYGVHVIKKYWRRRIGTSTLKFILEMAKNRGVSRVSVVRVFRSIKGTASDIRAVSFYKANNPAIRLSIYKLR